MAWFAAEETIRDSNLFIIARAWASSARSSSSAAEGSTALAGAASTGALGGDASWDLPLGLAPRPKVLLPPWDAAASQGSGGAARSPVWASPATAPRAEEAGSSATTVAALPGVGVAA